MEAHGVAADDQIANLSAGERRQQIDEVQRQIRPVLLHTIPSPARRPRRDARHLAPAAKTPRPAQRLRPWTSDRRSTERDAVPLAPRHCGWQMTSPVILASSARRGRFGRGGPRRVGAARRGSACGTTSTRRVIPRHHEPSPTQRRRARAHSPPRGIGTSPAPPWATSCSFGLKAGTPLVTPYRGGSP